MNFINVEDNIIPIDIDIPTDNVAKPLEIACEKSFSTICTMVL